MTASTDTIAAFRAAAKAERLKCLQDDAEFGEVWSNGVVTLVIDHNVYGDGDGPMAYAFAGQMDTDHDCAEKFTAATPEEVYDAVDSATPKEVAELETFYSDADGSLTAQVARIAALPVYKRWDEVCDVVRAGDASAIREGFAPRPTAHAEIVALIAARDGEQDGRENAEDSEITYTGDEGVPELMPNGASDVIGYEGDLSEDEISAVELAYIEGWHRGMTEDRG